MSDQPKTVLLGPSDLIALGYCRPNGQVRGTASTATIPFRRPRHGRTRRRANTTPGMARLRQLIYPHIHGEKTACGVRPSLSKAVFLSMWNGGRITRIPKLANYRLADHSRGKATYYYWSRPDGRYLLPMIDVDVQKSCGQGTPEGARDFADYLDQQVILGCHWEPSTHGKGMQGFCVIDLGEDHESVTAAERKDILVRMQADLRKVARAYGADIELVEVKGHPPVIDSTGMHQARNTHVIRGMVYGQFAKIPRDIEAVAALKPVSLARLKELAAEVPDVVLTDRTRKTAGSCGGSCSGKVITEEMLALLPELEKLGEELLAGRRLLEGRKVTAYDVACVLLLAWVFGQPGNANPDGSMPTRRFQVMWDALYEAGDFKRGWSPNRFKAARDLLSEEGLIDWIDETYCHGEGGGRACRWRLTAEMATAIDGLAGPGQEGEAPSVNSSPPSIVHNLPRTGRNLRPVRVWAVRRVIRPTKIYLHEYSLAA
jgi:hypothetical protein